MIGLTCREGRGPDCIATSRFVSTLADLAQRLLKDSQVSLVTMSGFEVAGVVLGAFPIAITALDKYREVATRLGLFFKIQLEYKKWRDDLEFHRLLFARHMRQLLLPLVADDDKIKVLLAAPAGVAWQDPSIASLLEKRLGESYELYFEYMKGIKRVMNDINLELAVDSNSVQERLKASANPKTITTKEKVVFQLYRLKFSNNEAIRKRLFGDLQEYCNKLEKLLGSSDDEERLVQERTAVSQLAAIDATLCNFWVQARGLFKALIASLQGCRCQQHSAKLLLQHRATKQPPEFQIIFTAFYASRWDIHTTRISRDYEAQAVVATVVREGIALLENTSISVSQPDHRRNRPAKSSFRTKSRKAATTTMCVELPSRPSPSVTLTRAPVPHQNMPPQIFNLCASLGLPAGSCAGYLAGDEYRYYVHTLAHHHHNDTSPPQSITLEQILLGNNTAFPTPTRSQRYALSLTMASSFLQLLDSPWLPSAHSFSKADVHFPRDETTSGIFLLDRPYITHSLNTKTQHEHEPQTAKPNPSPPTTHPAAAFTDALDHLGILLLELCFGRPLETQPSRISWPAGATPQQKAVFDIMAARTWQCDVLPEAGADYAEAVAWCLGGNRSTPPDRWRAEMLRRVVGPLQRCRDYLVSGGMPG